MLGSRVLGRCWQKCDGIQDVASAMAAMVVNVVGKPMRRRNGGEQAKERR